MGNIQHFWLRLLPASMRARLADRPNLHLVMGNSAWLFFDKLVRMVLEVIVGAWVARYLGPALFGELAYVLAFVAFFRVIATFGADGIIVSDIARNRDGAPAILGTALRIRIGLGVLTWLLALGSMAMLRPYDREALLLVAIIGGVLVFQAADTVDLWFQSQSQSKRTVAAKIFAYLSSNGLKVVLIFYHAPLVAFAWVMLIELVVATIGLVIAYRRYPSTSSWRGDMAVAKLLVSRSWPFLISGLAIVVYMRIDQLMLREMLGEYELGIYSAAMPLAQMWYFLPTILAVSLAPYIARKKLEGEVAYYGALQRIFRIFGALAILVSLITSVLSSTLIDLFYGVAYGASSSALAILAFTNIAVFLGVAQNLWLVNENAARLSLYKTLLGGIASVLGNLVLIPILGIRGSAIASVVSFTIAAVVCNSFLAPRIFRMQLGLPQKN